MELKGEKDIAAPRQQVWDALNDPAVLARCIDGVERLEAEADDRLSGTLAASVGPVKARFSGTVTLSERDPPNRYVLVGEGKGGPAGFVKGSAEVQLADLADGGTRLSYVATSQFGGRLAQLGARLIEGTARGYAETFFARLQAEVEAPATAADAAPAAVAEAPAPLAVLTDEPQAEPETAGIPPVIWIGVLVSLTALLLVWLL